MRLRSVLGKSPSELACRGWQESVKRFDRVVAAARGDGRQSPRVLHRLNGDPVLRGIRARRRAGSPGEAARLLFDHFHGHGAGRFFAGAVGGRAAALIAERAPEERDRIIAAADRVCQKLFDLLGYRELSFGIPVDWHRDAVSGRRVPPVHFSRIDPLDAGTVGDSKVIWELNRHQWLLDLGQAYQFTHDERYAYTFIELVDEWIRANPPGTGINWTSSLEAAFRLISWCWALHLFRGSRTLTAERFVELLDLVRIHARHVERYLSTYFSPNTHLTGEALGLFYVGVAFPELDDSERWRTKGRRILTAQVERQVLADGVYFEQSTHYQRYTAEIYLHFLILAARNGISLPVSVAQRTRQVLDFLLALMHPDGSVPQIGDADGGSLQPFVHRSPEDYRGVFGLAAAFFRRAEYAWAAGGAAPEALWLLGAPAVDAIDALEPAPPKGADTRIFPYGGYAVMRTGWHEDAHQLIFDVGPLGCPLSGGHGHADLLSIQCTAFGEPYLVDPGTGCYTGEMQWRDYFRSTAAHNAVTVDGRDQAIPTGPFSWNRRPSARLRRRFGSDGDDLIDADHDAYMGLADPVRHRRRVFFARPRYFVVIDDLEGAAEHEIELHFQFAPIEVSLERNAWVRARRPSGRGLLLRTFAAIPLAPSLAQGRHDPMMRGWVSPNYGQREPAPALGIVSAARLPLRLITLLLPVAEADAAPPAVTVLGDGTPSGLEFGCWRERVVIGAEAVQRERW